MTTDEFINTVVALQPAMHSVARRYLQDECAADAVQDTLVSLWRKRGRLRRMDNVRAYCLMAVRNRCIDMLRASHNTERLEAATADSLSDEGMEEALEAERRFAKLEQALATLSPQQQQLVRMRYVEQLGSRDIARITGLSESNVDTIMSRIYAELRLRLGKDYTTGTE